MRTRKWLALGLVLAVGGAARADEPATERAEAGVTRALGDWRIGQGLPPCEPCEALAIVAREQAAALAALGWGGGGLPKELDPISSRAWDRHRLAGAPVAGYAAADPQAVDPAAIAASLRGGALGPSLASPTHRVLAVGVAPGAKGWVVAVALMESPPPGLAELRARIAGESAGLDAEDEATRAATCKALGALGNVEVLPALRRALRDPATAVRAAAATALQWVGSRGSVPPLLEALADGEAPVREAAGSALQGLTGVDHGPDVAAWRAWWSGDAAKKLVGSADAIDPAHVPPPQRALAAIVGELNTAGGPGLGDRRAALLRELREHSGRRDSTVAAAAVRALSDPVSRARIEAARLAAVLRLPAAVPALCKLAAPGKTGNKEVTRIALLALAQIGDLRALDVFTAPVRDWANDWEARSTRIFAIRYLRSARSVEWLLREFSPFSVQVEGAGSMKDPIAESLEHLTGETLGNYQKGWQKWWKSAKARFRPEPLPDDYQVEGLFDSR